MAFIRRIRAMGRLARMRKAKQAVAKRQPQEKGASTSRQIFNKLTLGPIREQLRRKGKNPGSSTIETMIKDRQSKPQILTFLTAQYEASGMKRREAQKKALAEFSRFQKEHMRQKK